MLRWFEQTDAGRRGIISSRIRLARNWREYAFPARLSEKESAELVHRLEFGLKDLPKEEGMAFEYAMLPDLDELDRAALRERRALNAAAVSKKEPCGIYLSEDESAGILLNGDDHIRLQLLAPGLRLEELWEKADRLDDYINERFPYAYDDKYGYLTSFPTNVGTGLRAGVVVHLPMLSMGRKFPNLISDMSRFGTAIRGVYGEGEENFGSLFEISNQKTLGISEKEIVDTVTKAAIQLTNQENQVRKMTLSRRRIEREDEVYKSYGVLKYARRMTARDSMIFLSQLMAGVADGLMEIDEKCSIYRIMLGIQPANLQKLSDKPLNKEELDCARADFIRSELPELR